MILDLFAFTRQEEQATGEIPVAALTRVDTPDPRGALTWSARGSMRGRHGMPRLDLRIDGSIALVCQRCLKPMHETVRIATRLLVAADEAAADALDQDDDYDVVVGSTAFDLDTLIEDEVLLALPNAPRHGDCPDEPGDPARGSDRPSPFAALAALRSGKPRDGGDA